MTTPETWRDPDAREPWCPGPDKFPCPRCGECGGGCLELFAQGAAFPCLKGARTLGFDEWALLCLQHGLFVGLVTLSGPPYNAANKPRRLVLDIGLGAKWWRRGYGNTFDGAFRDAMARPAESLDL